MSLAAHIASAEVRAQMHDIIARFGKMVGNMPIAEREPLIGEMIGAGAALIAAGVASAENPTACRIAVDDNIEGLLDRLVAVHSLAMAMEPKKQ